MPEPQHPDSFGQPEAAGKWRSRSMWAGRVRNELHRVRGEVTALNATEGIPSATRSIISSIQNNAIDAENVLQEHFKHNLLRQISGATGAYQAAMSAVYRASEDLFLVQDDATVKARLPALRAAIRTYLSPEDPRREGYLHRIDAALVAIGAERQAMENQHPGSDAGSNSTEVA
jgi:hypothetical protein